jgi:hypothetical protein
VHLYNYFVGRQQEIDTLSDDLEFGISADDQSGWMRGNINVSDELYVSVLERVELRDGTPTIVKYSYAILDDGVNIAAFDNDPLHDPAVHWHVGESRRRVPASEMTLHAVLERAWKEAELRESTIPPGSASSEQHG